MRIIASHPDHSWTCRNRDLYLDLQMVFGRVNISGGAHYTIDHEFIHGMGGIVVQLGIRRDNPVACNENTCEIVGEDPSIAIIKCILLNQYRRISIDGGWFKIWQKMRILIWLHNLYQKRLRILWVILQERWTYDWDGQLAIVGVVKLRSICYYYLHTISISKYMWHKCDYDRDDVRADWVLF